MLHPKASFRLICERERCRTNPLSVSVTILHPLFAGILNYARKLRKGIRLEDVFLIEVWWGYDQAMVAIERFS